MKRTSRILVLVLCSQLALPARMHAQSQPDAGTATTATQTTNLNLRSAQRNISASQVGNLGTVDIRLGGNVRTVTPQDMLTAAELVAVQQVVSTGSQSINLSARGRATGGTFSVTPELSTMMSSLVVPRGVTAVYDAGASQAINLAGDLTNRGTLYALSSNPQVTNATISAANIINGERALISTILPATSGLAGAVGNLDLSLSALHNILNAGTISSAGNLNLTAGGSIINASATGGSPVIQAMNNINLFTGNLVNSGTIASSLGNINVTSQMVQNIAINNIGGLLQALAGAINVRDSAFTGAANLTMTGGDFLARELNLYSGKGEVTADVERVLGTMNVYANEAHVSTASDSLALGTIKLDGDPTFVNSTGGIVITGLVTFAEGIAIIANGNITASGPAQVQATDGTNGFDIWMIAGASVTGGADSPTLPGGSPTAASVNFTTGNGGNIDLSGSTTLGTILLTSGATAGNVTLAARANGATGGRVIFPAGAGAIDATGTVKNGNVTIIAGATSGTAVSMPGIISTNGPGTAGSVTITTAQPVTSDGLALTFDSSGNKSSTNTLVASTTIAGSAISTGQILAGSGTISETAGTNITGGQLSAGSVSLRTITGSIGTAVTPVSTDAGTGAAEGLTITSGASAFITESGGVRLLTSTFAASSGILELTTTGSGDLIVAGTVSGPSSASGQRIKLSTADGSILRSGSVTLDRTLSATTVDLISVGGNIGEPVGTGGGPIQTNANAALKVTATSTAPSQGNAYVAELNAVTLGASTVDKEYVLTAGNSIFIDQNITATSSTGRLALTATLNNILNNTGSTARLTAETIHLSATGSIGTATADPIRTNAGSSGGLQVNTNGSGSAFISEADDVRLLASTVGTTGVFELKTTGVAEKKNVIIDGGVTNSALASVSRVTIDVQNGDILHSSGSLKGSTVELITHTSGNSIGTSTARVQVDAGNTGTTGLRVTSAGDAYVSEDNSVQLLASTASGTYDVTAATNLTSLATGTVSANAVSLTATGGSLTLAGTLTGSNSVSLTSNSSINNGTFGTISTQTLNLRSTGGSIGSSGALNINVANFSANAVTGNVAVNAAGSSNISAASSALGSFSVTAADNLTSSSAGTVSADAVNLTATSGTLALAGTITGTTSVSLTAGSNINNGAFGTVNTQTLNLRSTVGSIGSSGALNISVAHFSANAANGNVAMNASGSTSIAAASSALGSFSVTAADNLTSSSDGTVSANTVNLTATSGSLALAGTVTGTTSVSLTAGSNINNGAFGTVNTQTLNLTSTGGSIGSSDALNISVANFSASAGTGNVAINAAGSTNISSASSALGSFSVTAADNLTTSGTGTVNAGNVNLTATAGSLLLSGPVTGTSGVVLTATGGNIGVNSSVSASAGNVDVTGSSVSVGASGQVQTTGIGGAIAMNTANVVNAGSVSAAGLLSIQNSNSVVVSGNGNLAGATILVASGGGSVTVEAGSIAGPVTGSAAGGFSVVAASGGLTAGSITAGGPLTLQAETVLVANDATVHASGGTVSINTAALENHGSVSSDNSVAVQGAAGLTVTGAGALSGLGGILLDGGSGALAASAGTLNGVVSASGDSVSVTAQSGNLAVATVSALSGGVALAASAGNLSVNGNVSAGGGSVSLSSAGAMTVAAGSIDGSVSASGASIDIATLHGNLHVSAASSSAGGLTLTAGGGLLTISGNVSTTGGNVVLNGQTSVTVGTSGSVQAASPGASTTIVTASLANAGSVGAAGLLSIQNAGNLSVTGPGILAAGQQVSLVSTSGSVSAAAGSVTGTVIGSAADSFALTVGGGGLTAGNIATTNGSLDLVVGDGTLTIAAGATLSATEGNLTIRNTNITSGTISVGLNAVLTAFSAGTTLGRINIVIGDVPTTPVAGNTPANFVVTLANGGQIYFGNNGATAQPPNNLATVDGSVVIIDTGSRPASAINFGGGVRLNATASNPAQVTLIDSLDLTSAPVISLILTLQGNGQVGGNLLVVNGIVVGGNLIVDPTDLAPVLTAANIPKDVTLTFDGFQSANVVSVSLTATSTSSQVMFAGTQEFTRASGPSAGTISIASTQNGPLLVMPSTGLLRSDGSLTVSVAGGMSLTGNVSAQHLVLETTANNGDIIIGALMTGTASATVSAHGTGSIIQSSGAIRGASVTLASERGNIGRALAPVNTQADLLRATTGGRGCVFLNEADSVTLLDSRSGSSFKILAGGSLSINDVTAGEGSIRAIAGSGTLTVAPHSVLFANEGNILLHNTDGSTGSIFIGEGSLINAFTWGAPQLGNVRVIVGPIHENVPVGNKPENTTVVRAFGGRVFFGAKGIKALAPTNLLLALGRDITFDTNGRPANTITLGGLVTIIADPPPPAAIPVTRPSQTVGAIGKTPAGPVVAPASPAPLAYSTWPGVDTGTIGIQSTLASTYSRNNPAVSLAVPPSITPSSSFGYPLKKRAAGAGSLRVPDFHKQLALYIAAPLGGAAPRPQPSTGVPGNSALPLKKPAAGTPRNSVSPRRKPIARAAAPRISTSPRKKVASAVAAPRNGSSPRNTVPARAATPFSNMFSRVPSLILDVLARAGWPLNSKSPQKQVAARSGAPVIGTSAHKKLAARPAPARTRVSAHTRLARRPVAALSKVTSPKTLAAQSTGRKPAPIVGVPTRKLVLVLSPAMLSYDQALAPTPAMFWRNSVDTGTDTDSLDTGALSPVAFTYPTSAAIVDSAGLNLLTTETALVRYWSGTQFADAPSNTVGLEYGEALISARKDTEVKSGSITIAIAPGTDVLIERNADVLIVRNLHERGLESVRISIEDKYSTPLAAGQEVMIGPDDFALDRQRMADAIGRRGLKRAGLTSGASVATCEVSLVSLVGRSNLMCYLMHSQESSDCEILDRIVKMAACLHLTTQAHGPYSSMHDRQSSTP